MPGVNDPMGPVVITSRDIYDALIRLTDTVNRLVNAGDGYTEDLRDHETRLRALEATRWPVPTIAILVALASLVLGAVPYFS